MAIATAGAFAAHEARTALLTTGDLIGTGLTLLLGLKYGIAKFSLFDILCQAGAIVGLGLWFAFNSPVVGIVAVLVVDFFGSLPTVKHAWVDPREETWQTFLVITAATVLTLVSLSSFTVASLSYPIYLLLANGVVVCIVVYRRTKLGISLSRHGEHEALHEELG